MLNLEKFTALKSVNPSPKQHLVIGWHIPTHRRNVSHTVFEKTWIRYFEGEFAYFVFLIRTWPTYYLSPILPFDQNWTIRPTNQLKFVVLVFWDLNDKHTNFGEILCVRLTFFRLFGIRTFIIRYDRLISASNCNQLIRADNTQNVSIRLGTVHGHRSMISSQNCCGLAWTPNRQAWWVWLDRTVAYLRNRDFEFCSWNNNLLFHAKIQNLDHEKSSERISIRLRKRSELTKTQLWNQRSLKSHRWKCHTKILYSSL